MEYIKNFDNVSFEHLSANIWLVRGHENGKAFGDPFNWGFVLIVSEKISYAKMLIAKESSIKPTQIKSISKFLKSLNCTPKVTWERRFTNKSEHSIKYDK